MNLPLLFVVGMAVGAQSQSSYTPVVLMHGLMATSEAMSHAADWIQEDFPGIYILNVVIGDDYNLNSLLIGMNLQVEWFANVVMSDPNLANGFNFIGHSQGALIGRAYVERFNNPAVKTFVSWAGPQDGVFGVPDFNDWCPDEVCPLLNEIFDYCVEDPNYAGLIQDFMSFAGYWKDPTHYDVYLATNNFLADINNERNITNSTYKENWSSLEKLLLIYSSDDHIVVPESSPWFQFFTIGQDIEVSSFNQTDQYSEDLIGLRTLYESNKIIFGTVPCSHQNIPREVCKPYYDLYTKPLLG